MKMKRVFITIVVIGFFFSSLFAKPVDEKRAVDIALIFVAAWDQPVQAAIDKVQAKYLPDGTKSYYIVHLENQGWILVSADDVVQPILAFSFENRFLPEEQWNDAARYLLTGYHDQIGLAIKDKTLGQHAGWEQIKFPADKKSAAVIIEPFIDVKWNQGSGWNRFCPDDEDGPGEHAYVGCVAVAMAQAMTVYDYPVKSSGVKSYLHDTYGSIFVNYDLADPYEWNLMSNNSSDDYNAKLLYHCAVSVEMDFGPDGSGAYVRTASGALKKYFNYAQTTQFKSRYDDEQEWEDLLVNELSEGRPIVYRGEPDDGTAGHAWNVDGYGDGYFHMNFGWSGSQNGYYTLNLINPGSNDFSENQGAIIGLRPPDSGPFDINLSATTVKEKLPEGSFVAEIMVDDEDPANTYTYTCLGPYSIIFDRRDISNNFFIENDTLWTKIVLEYNDEDPSRNLKNILIIVEDQYGSEFQKEFDILVEDSQSGSTDLIVNKSDPPGIYPNPADNYLFISNESNSIKSYRMYDLTGREVLQGFPEDRVDVAGLNEGAYIIILETQDKTYTRKILIRHF